MKKLIQTQPAGKRKHRVKIQQRVSTPDALGQASESWVDVASVWASAEPIRGREFFAAGAMQNEVTVKFGIMYLQSVTAAMRVQWNGVNHAIVGEPINVGGDFQQLELMCAAGVRDG